jgi:glycerol uptake facilitator-like aquaporin
LLPKLLAEFLGTGLIVMTVLGAGFMTANLAAEASIGLTMIALAVAAVLFVAITIFAPVSGSHFNPIVSLGLLVRGKFGASESFAYIVTQLLGGVAGSFVANAMFSSNFALSEVSRINSGTFIGEVVASAGLVLIVLLLVEKQRSQLVAGSVALWILAGHLFTSSTSFANPAVTLGRIFSSSPSSISIDSALLFSLAQLIGLVVALLILSALSRKESHD